MRKLAWMMAALLLLASFTACGKKKREPTRTPTDTGALSITESQSENGAVKVKRNENGSLTITVELPEYKGEDVSIVISKDRKSAEKLTNAEGVLAVEQITLDASGRGIVTLLPSENGACFVSVNGKNIVQVKG